MAWTVTPLLPENNATDVAVLPEFTWTKVDGGGNATPMVRVNFGGHINGQNGVSGMTDGYYWNNIYNPGQELDCAVETGLMSGWTCELTDNNNMNTGDGFLTPYLDIVGDASMTNPSAHGSQKVSTTMAQSWHSGQHLKVKFRGLDPTKTYNVYWYGHRSGGTVGFEWWVNSDTANKVIYTHAAHEDHPVDYTEFSQVLGASPTAGGDLFLNTDSANGPMTIAIAVFVEEVAGGGAEPSTLLRISDSDPTLATGTDVTLATATSLQLYEGNELEEDTTYYWGVAIDDENDAFTEVRQFTTESNNPLVKPILTTPHPGAFDVSHTPTVTWAGNDIASLYDMQLSTNPDFSGSLGTSLWNYTDLPNQYYTFPTDLDREVTYYWRVKSVWTIYKSDWSDSRSFTTKFGAPELPILVSPALNAEGVSLTHTFTWSDGGGAEYYDFYLDIDGSFSSGPIATDIVVEQYIAQGGDLLNATPYYWKVVAHGDGQTADSGVRYFSTAAPNVPLKPSLVSPLDDASDLYVRPTFVWTAPAGATKYRLEVADNSEFINAIIYDDLAGLTQTITEFLAPGTVYHWKVTAGNGNGWGGESDPKSFTTQPQQSVALPTLISPTDEALAQPLAPTFEWEWTAPEAGNGENYGALPSALTRSIQSIVIDFATEYTSFAVEKAPLKYDKKGVATLHIDDNGKFIYDTTFPASKNNFYTDGCGNDIPMAFGAAHWAIKDNGKFVHEDVGYEPLMITWAEMAEMVAGGNSIATQAWVERAVDSNLGLLDAVTKWKTARRQSFPGGLVRGFDTKVYVGEYGHDVAAIALANGAYGNDTANYGGAGLTNDTYGSDLNVPCSDTFFEKIQRKIEGDSGAVVQMIANQGPNERKWLNFGSHYPSTGFFTSLAPVAKNGTDEVWVPSVQELIEYIWARENVIVNVDDSEPTQVTLTLDTTNLRGDMWWYALSLNIQADANISNITINGGINEGVRKNSHNINYQSALVNLQWNGNDYIPRETMADDKVTIAESSNTMENRSIARAYLNLVPLGSERTALESRLGVLGAFASFVTAEDPGTVEEGLTQTFDPEGLAMKYDLMIAPDSAPSSPVLDLEDITNKTYTLSSELAADSEYQWKVRARNEIATSPWTDVWNFNTIFGPPTMPVEVTPGYQQGNVTNMTIIEWSGGGEVTYWEFTLSDDAGYNNVMEYRNNYQYTQFGLSETSLELNTTYYWKVTGWNQYGEGQTYESEFTTALPAAPGLPTYLSPQENQTGVSRVPTLQWVPIERALTYSAELRVDNPGGANDNLLILSQTGVEDAFVIVSQPLDYSTVYKWRVKGVNTNPDGEAWGLYRRFTTENEPAPGSPSLITPVDTLAGVPSPINFTWDAVLFATKYLLEIATADEFGDGTIAYIADIPEASYTYTPELDYNTTYFWRVTASNLLPGLPSEISSFTTAQIPHTSPIVITGPDAAVPQDLTVLFQWIEDNLADDYEIQVAHTITGSLGTEGQYESLFSYGSEKLSNVNGYLEYGQSYVWRIRGRNDAGSGQWSANSYFTCIPLPAPEAVTNIQVSDTGVTPTITWDASDLATSYSLTIARSGLTRGHDPNDPTYTVSSGLELYYETQYTITVQARNSSGLSASTEMTYITGSPDLPTGPPIITPSNNSTGVSVLPMLSWTSAGSNSEYQVQMQHSGGGSTITGIEESYYQKETELEYNTLYTWSVKLKMSFNEGTLIKLTEASPEFTFTTQSPPIPATPVVLPTGSNISRKPLITWQADADTVSWNLQVATDAGFNSIVYNETGLTTTSFQVPSNLEYGTAYYVKVTGVNSFYPSGGPDGTAEFTTIALVVPDQVVISSPASGLTYQTRNSVTYQWDTVAGADEYYYELIDDNGGSWSGTTTETTLTFEKPLLWWDRLYTFKVQGFNEVHTGAFSENHTYETRTPAHGAPTPVYPNLNNVVGIASGDVAFSFWGPKFYELEEWILEVATDVGFNNIIHSSEGDIPGAISEPTGYPHDYDIVEIVPGSTFNFSTTYFWRVTNWNPWTTATSTTTSFVTEDIPTPKGPDLYQPANVAVNIDPRTTFTWEGVAYGDEYTLSVYADEELSQEILSVTTTDLSYEVPLDTLDFLSKYYWIVTSRSTFYGTQADSSVQEFTTVDVLVPGQPNLDYPHTNAQVTVYEDIKWQETINTDSYILQVSRDEYFQTVDLEIEELAELSVELTDQLTHGTYYTRVKAKNHITTSMWSNHVKFDYYLTEEAPDPTIVTDPIEESDLGDLADITGTLASRIAYGLCDKEVYEDAFELLLEHEYANACEPAVSGKDIYSISVQEDGTGSYFFKHGYYRVASNLVEFQIKPGIGYHVEYAKVNGVDATMTPNNTWTFEMPEANVLVEINYCPAVPYGLEWSDRICVGSYAIFDFKWTNRACQKTKAAFTLEWADRVCVITPPDYELEWSERICEAVVTEFVLEWADKICVATQSKFKLQLEWSNRVCVRQSPTYNLQWSNKICSIKKLTTYTSK